MPSPLPWGEPIVLAGIISQQLLRHGNGRSDSATQNNTHVSAASTATIISGGDTNITGSNLSGRQVSATIGGNLNMASVQDTMSSAAHQESSGGGFTLSQGGGSASVSHTSANASGNYAGVNEQAGIQAGDGGFDISVKGHTGLNGAYLAGSADASKNTLTTGTLTFSDISNTSNYKASSSGFSAGVSTGDGGANYSTHGNTSGKNTGGGTPMLSQNDSGNDSTTTRSRISAGTISVTDAASQRQDITSLNRDASNTNGTIARLPDVNNLLERQADMMAAASAAGEAVSRRIGDYAQSKYDAAKARGDQAGMEAWKEGGTARAGMQVAGAAMVTGLAGGNAPGSAAGAGIASIAAGKLNEISAAIAGSNPTGSADINTALGNIVANAIATGAGAAVGGNAGAVAGGNVDRFNRQLHPEEEKWISEKEAAYAKKYGLTPEQAHNELTMQANLQVQNGSPGTWNQRASAFLGQAHGMLPADGASGPGYMFYATPDQKANPNMYAGYYANGGDLNQPSTQQIQNSASREQQNRNLMGGGVIAAVTGASLLVGGPIAAGAGGLAYSVIGGGVSAGMDAAVQYQQTGEIRPAQSLFAGGVGAIAGPIGANTKFFSNVVLGGSSYFSTTIFNNLYYGEANSPLYAGAIGSLAGAGGYGIGLVLTQGVGRLATPWIFPNLDPKIPAVFQAVRNPLPGLTGATGGGLIGGTGAFAPGKEAQK
ncbi:hemagglutinin repeat-containing protein [Paraburkholderia bonniea]|uniref:hemagglutinin repeat-containing protein n=1 Tax=Paraburkholderia bonniea TaxID=2152891 RepID=UPI0033062EBE